MSVRGNESGGRPARAKRLRWLAPVLLTGTLAAGCDHPFEPFQENTVGPFSIFGYLDLNADIQWIRVMPIRQNLLPDPAPIDAVVTLEHLGSGRVVTLRDSLFAFNDPRLDGIGYAHNFWTTEPIESEATYRLTAARSDGATTTALVEMPPALDFSLLFSLLPRTSIREPRRLFVPAEHLLYTDVLYTVWDRSIDRAGDPVSVRQLPVAAEPGTWEFLLPGVGEFQGLNMPPFIDRFRREARIAVAGSDWPYEPGLSPLEVAIPGLIASTVENGVGSVRGVATWTIPLPLCHPLEARADGSRDCTTGFGPSSASILGTVTRDPCGDPMQLPTVRLTERYADGGAVVWEWKTDWEGDYRFEGLEPGSDLLLEFENHPAGALEISPLEPGERYAVPDVTLPSSCAAGEVLPGEDAQRP